MVKHPTSPETVEDAVDAFLGKRSDRHAKALAKFDELPDAAGVDDKVVAALCSCNVSTVWDRVKKGTFLQPIRIGGSTRWNVGQLRSFLAGSPLDPNPTSRQAAPSRTKHARHPTQQSLRDQFASQALAGLLASGWCEEERIVADNWSTIARDAYKAADAMLAARGGA